MPHEEEFSYRLADYAWHKVALSVSGTEIQLLIDCHPLYRRVIHNMPDRNFSASSMKLFVGQRNLKSQYLFKVSSTNCYHRLKSIIQSSQLSNKLLFFFVVLCR